MDSPQLQFTFELWDEMDTDGVQLAADAAEAMDQAQIPNVLWGHQAIRLAGTSSPETDIDFVVPDNLIDSASNALHEAGFPICGDNNCDLLQHDQHRAIPEAHSHLERLTIWERTVKIFKKSSHLWWLPEFTLDPPAEDDSHFMLSTDSRLPPALPLGGTGPWTDLYPIKILNPNTLTDSVIMLFCRDWDQLNGFEDDWLYMLIKLMESSDNPEAVVLKNVRPEFQEFWSNFNAHHPSVNVYVPLAELQERMNANNELPPPPPIDAYGSPERARNAGVGCRVSRNDSDSDSIHYSDSDSD